MIRSNQQHAFSRLLPAYLFLCTFLIGYGEVINTVQFRTYSFDGTHRWYYAPEPDAEAHLVFLNRGFAGNYDYAGPSPLSFYQMETNEAGVSVPVEQAKAMLPDEGDQLLLILFPRNGNQTRNPIYVIDESETQFPARHVRLFNFCPVPMALHFGDSPHIIEPNRYLTLQPDPVRHENYRVRVGKRSNNDQWELIKTSLWAMEPHQRTLIFLTPDDRHPDAVTLNKLIQNLPHDTTRGADDDAQPFAPSEILIERKQ